MLYDCKKMPLQLLWQLALLVFTMQPCMAQLPVDTARLGHNPQAGQYVSLRGFNMYYEVYGKGEPLLFIHGNGGSITDFSNQVAYFARYYKVILADSRAQGRSADGSDSLSYEMMSDDFSALLDHLKADSCNIVGWSDGGINALLLALRHPEKVKKLVSTGANLWPDTTALDPWIYQVLVKEQARINSLPATTKLKNEKKLVKLMLTEPHINPAYLAKISCPALIMGGDHDVILPAHTMLIAASIPRSYLWILPNSGHSTMITYKDTFNKTVLDFLQKPYRPIAGAAQLQ